ncbi:hypothetical protein [Coleofasciculus sp. H7-2]|uniref:hypothetical protein n=1 Tax=Coleofasciculus sp. H7-2 TaxID=3351545 RepID=UPI00366C4F69
MILLTSIPRTEDGTFNQRDRSRSPRAIRLRDRAASRAGCLIGSLNCAENR